MGLESTFSEPFLSSKKFSLPLKWMPDEREPKVFGSVEIALAPHWEQLGDAVVNAAVA